MATSDALSLSIPEVIESLPLSLRRLPEKTNEVRGIDAAVPGEILNSFQSPNCCCLANVLVTVQVHPLDNFEYRLKLFGIISSQKLNQMVCEIGKIKIQKAGFISRVGEYNCHLAWYEGHASNSNGITSSLRIITIQAPNARHHRAAASQSSNDEKSASAAPVHVVVIWRLQGFRVAISIVHDVAFIVIPYGDEVFNSVFHINRFNWVR